LNARHDTPKQEKFFVALRLKPLAYRKRQTVAGRAVRVIQLAS
jgi:hypothetical protein